MNINLQISCLEKIHEDILYALECLVEDYTRETRYELSNILKDNAFTKLDRLYQAHIEIAISQIKDSLVHNSSDRDARSSLVKLRREVRNTICELSGQKQLYNYAPVIK